MTTTKISSLLTLLVLFAACATNRGSRTNGSSASLKETFAQDFTIGTAVDSRQIAGQDAGAGQLIPKQFNTLTPENLMKAVIIHPDYGKYNFGPADSLVAYAAKHGMQVNGHTLIWHSQLPGFVRRMKDADSVRQFFNDHISTIASRYNGKIYSWDVVNEALNEDGSMRKSIFLDKLGDDFVVEAFRLAQAAAPQTKLYYNDYNIEQPKKRAGALALIRKIQAAGVRIDGVGIQGHWHLHTVPYADIEASIREFSALGIEVMFTELDISVLPSPRNIVGADVNQRAAYESSMNPYKQSLPDSVQQSLARDYAKLFSLFLKYSKEVSRVTFWGVDDGQSWLNNFPVRGRTNHALLFDRNFQPKPAFYSVLQTKTSNK